MKKTVAILTVMLGICLKSSGQLPGYIYDESIKTLQVIANGDPLSPAVFPIDGHKCLSIGWDQMSHDYHRYLYRIVHCGWDWEPSDQIFESDYLRGTNNLPVEEYETSFNTSQIYTHYTLTLPNENTGILLSGNYKVLIFPDDSGTDTESPVLEVRFSVYERTASVAMEISTNTDVDFNSTHQQVSLKVGYGSLSVTDPIGQLHTVVTQNRRTDRTVTDIEPNIRKANGIEFTHNRNLIFTGGAEFHKFEILDVHQSGMGVDNMRWYEPYWHATLWEDVPSTNFIEDEDQNGSFIVRHDGDEDNETMSEYLIVHFTLKSPRLPQDVYVSGLWTNGMLDPECKMEYDDYAGCYHLGKLLKQGYYNYEYILADGTTAKTMGDFWQTENEYQTFVYYRELGGRYDRLVAYTCANTGL